LYNFAFYLLYVILFTVLVAVTGLLVRPSPRQHHQGCYQAGSVGVTHPKITLLKIIMENPEKKHIFSVLSFIQHK